MLGRLTTSEIRFASLASLFGTSGRSITNCGAPSELHDLTLGSHEPSSENDTKNTGSGELQVQYYATNNLFENNIVYATSQGLLINNYTNSEPNPVSADYNLYFSSVNSASADFVWNGTDHSGFAGYQSATGQDAHSNYADPDFLSLTTPNLQVGTASPALGAGVNLGPTIEGSTDFAGNPRVTGSTIDIGAYQQ